MPSSSPVSPLRTLIGKRSAASTSRRRRALRLRGLLRHRPGPRRTRSAGLVDGGGSHRPGRGRRRIVEIDAGPGHRVLYHQAGRSGPSRLRRGFALRTPTSSSRARRQHYVSCSSEGEGGAHSFRAQVEAFVVTSGLHSGSKKILFKDTHVRGPRRECQTVSALVTRNSPATAESTEKPTPSPPRPWGELREPRASLGWSWMHGQVESS